MNPKNKSIVGLVILFLLVAVSSADGLAQGSDPTDDQVNAIARQLYCPVCENIPLDACGTAACEQWRGIIRDKLAEGWTEEQIKAYFVEQYGDRVLAEPPREGFNLLVYLVPLLAFLVGAVLLFLGFQKWRQAALEREPGARPDGGPAGPDVPDDYLKRVERELESRSRSKQ